MGKPNFDIVEELRWRGILQDITPNTEELLKNQTVSLYLGIDPTADSLHIGHFAAIVTLMLFQKAGHKPYLVFGGATGMIGDPSGKSEERKLLDIQTIRNNLESIKKQMHRFLDFNDNTENAAVAVNNYDWTKDYSYLEFLRDIGKHITVNYMLSKESVKLRIERQTGISYTEFSYQLLQAFDFYVLFKDYNVTLQIGGSDQWGNITTGIELIRRKLGAEAHGLTIKLITKSDGKKFGKTEKGNLWLDPKRTSPYELYQYFINLSDEDAENFIKVFSLKPKDQILQTIEEHKKQPHKRILQQALASELTELIHGNEELQKAIAASQILFGKGTKEQLASLDEQTFLSVFDGVPTFEISKDELKQGINIVELLAVKTKVFNSKGEVRRLIKDNGLNLNQERVKSQDLTVDEKDLLNGKYLLVRKGKKNYSLILVK